VVEGYHLLHFPVQDSVALNCYTIEEHPEGGFLIGGSIRYPGTSTSGFIVRVSADGDTLWTRSYTEISIIYDIRQLPDGGFAIAGRRLADNNRGVVMRVDDQGSIQWIRFLCGRGPLGMAMEVLDEGSIVTFCGYREFGMPSTHWERQIAKWSATGELLWYHHSAYGHTVGCTDIEVLSDQGFITSGYSRSGAELQRFGPEGDSLWCRVYNWYGYGTNLLDVEPTSDGGFVATGSAQKLMGTFNGPWLYAIVVLKTDSMGCVLPGCHTVGVDEQVVGLHHDLRVWPNPAPRNAQVHVELNVPPDLRVEGAVHAMLVDATGRHVAQWTMQQQGRSLLLTMAVDGLPAGMYYLHLTDGARWLAGAKLVVHG
jgi:hypothetical protein